MNPTLIEGTGETVPLRSGARTSAYLPIGAAGQTFGTTYFLSSTLLASIIPFIQLVIGLYYKGDCPIEQRIPTYMIVAGICGLALAGLSILLAVTFMCFISDSTALTLVASCGICLNLLATVIISVFVFIWFIVGCVWVFDVHHAVQYDHPKQSDYCHPVLYKGTFALLIIMIVWFVFQCCLSCFRSCCTGRNN